MHTAACCILRDAYQTRHLRLNNRMWRPLGYAILGKFLLPQRKRETIYPVWWVFYPGNIFLVDLYHETLGPGVGMGSYPFPFGINFFFSIHAKTRFFSRWRPSFDSRCEPCIVPKKVVFLREFLLANKKHSQFFWEQYTVHTGNRSLVSSDLKNGVSHGY